MLAKELKHISIKELLDKQEISVRAFNCCSTLKIESVYDIIAVFIDMPDNQRVKNAGKKTKQELHDVATKYAKLIEKSENNDKQLEKIVTGCLEGMSNGEKSVLRAMAQLIYDWDADVRIKLKKYGDLFLDNEELVSFYYKNGYLPFFKMVSLYFELNENKYVDIYVKLAGVFDGATSVDRNLIAQEYGYSVERIRQVYDSINKLIFAKENVSSLFPDAIRLLMTDSDLHKYITINLGNKDLLCSCDTIIDKLQQKEGVLFTHSFVMKLLSYILKDEYTFIDLDGTNIQASRYSYLIPNEICESFDFKKFVSVFNELYVNNDTEKDILLIDEITSWDCWNNGVDWSLLDRIVNVVQYAIVYEFQLASNFDGTITIPAVKDKDLKTIIFEALQGAGKPMHVNEIINYVIEHSTKQKNSNTIKYCIYSNADFVSVNSFGYYALAENNPEVIGSIKSKMVEFLKNQQTPMEVTDIFNYVRIYFPNTNINSIRSSMSNDAIFKRFSSTMFGLAEKKYDVSEEISGRVIYQRRTFEERLVDFERFLVTENRFPFCSSSNQEESSLYRWWNLSIKKCNSLSEEQRKEVERIKTKYSDLLSDRSEYEWIVACNKYRNYLLENYSIPKYNEMQFSSWYRRAFQDYQNDELTDRQRLKFVELLKLMKNVSR